MDAELERDFGQALQLVVGAEHADVDRADHPRHLLVGNLRERLLAEVVERKVGGEPDHHDVHVDLPDAEDAVDEVMVGGQVVHRGAVTAPLEHVLGWFDLGELREADRDQAIDFSAEFLLPLVVERAPVGIVIASAFLEPACSLLDLRRIGHRCGADVDVAVEDAEVDPHRWRNAEHAAAHLADRQVPGLGGDDVERCHRLGEMHPVEEPQAAFLFLPPILAEEEIVRIELLPPFRTGWCADLERARKPQCAAHPLPRSSSDSTDFIANDDANGAERKIPDRHC
ncbi:hypothetical protein OO015_11015 [Thermomicrobium sp. 4228-Ro]|uniref:hypothetical protein n=1 Tax=Thermomicrobium sp. 4228-Ro TaxID=2993937 RepID=UPI00224940B2|nr:hypothetical protein [Thermomicrobium sp. 4228-Ro]MCX2728021.1 hypothetical protein [Thermomicrobium sp. 4228-Ro]